MIRALVVFCEECGALVMPKKDKSDKLFLTCAKCGWKTDKINEDAYTVREEIFHDPSMNQTIVIDDSEEFDSPHAVIEMVCKRCGYNEASYFESQDSKGAEYEPALYYRCRKCGYIWKA